MSHRSTPLRIGLAAAIWLAAIASAFAQDARSITVTLSRADILVLSRALDALPIEQAAPLVIKLQNMIDAQPGNEDLKSAPPHFMGDAR
jgi:hypothetical protein